MLVSTRADWGCPPATVEPLPRRDGMSVHYPGPGAFRFADHSRCLSQVRSWDQMHRNRGSRMLEYGGMVCQHGYYIEGRGTWGNLLIRPGSNGTSDANSRFASVQFMAGTADAPPTDQELRWIAEVVARAQAQGLGPRVIGHRDTFPTACPGDPLQAALPTIAAYAANGPGAPTTPPAPTKPLEELMSTVLARRPDTGQIVLIGPAGRHWCSQADADALILSGYVLRPLAAHQIDAVDFMLRRVANDTAAASGRAAPAQYDADTAPSIPVDGAG